MQQLRTAFAHVASERAGVRLSDLNFDPDRFSAEGEIGALAASVLGPATRPVRALYFDKSEQANWSLGWHQDRVICVRDRLEVPGFSRWTVKSGLLHVSPPFDLLSRMATLRVHLDDVDEDNAPLIVSPGSHRIGRVKKSEIDGVISRLGSRQCLARAGDVWLYSTPILHASGTAILPRRRRVLQIDYAAFELPGGLSWHQLI